MFLNKLKGIDTESIHVQVLKKTVLYFLPVFVLAGLVLWIFHTREAHEDLRLTKTREQLHMTLLDNEISDNVGKVIRDDLKILASHQEMKVFLDTGISADLKILAQEFLVFSNTKLSYDQLRLIDLSGMEQIRVHRSDGKTSLVQKEDLQDKSRRPYFKEILSLDQGEIYFSPLDLNVENGLKDQLEIPVIRIGTPLFDSFGQKKGILIFNYLVKDLFNKLEAFPSAGSDETLLIGSSEFWFHSPVGINAWGVLNKTWKERRFEERYPEIWGKILTKERGQFISEIGLITFNSVYPYLDLKHEGAQSNNQTKGINPRASHPPWRLISITPNAQLYQRSNLTFKQMGILYLLFSMTLGGGCFLLAQLALENERATVFHRLATTVFENIEEAILVTDASEKILVVNAAFTKITGYPEKEVLGKTPRFLQSEKHDRLFYKAMWDSIHKTDHWKGEIWDKKKNGETYPKQLSVTAVRDKHGKVIQFSGLFSDITQRKQDEEALQRQVFYDALTDLPNRRMMVERLSQAIKQVRRSKKRLAVLFIDLDHFKQVNDTLGHAAGDEVLIEAGQRLLSSVRGGDTICRSGGDEFQAILTDVLEREEISIVCERMISKLSRPFFVDGQEVFIGASIGITICPDDSDEIGILLKNADMSMYTSKTSGRGTYYFFNRKMEQATVARSLLEWELRKALERQEFILHYQPIIDLTSLKTIALEALIRWVHPKKGLIMPDQFIPVAEASGLIILFGDLVLKTACQQMMKWKTQYGLDSFLCTNISSTQFKNDYFWKPITHALDMSGLPPESLILEVTEHLTLKQDNQSIEKLQRLKEIGINLAIDNFGKGYSSLSALAQAPVTWLKIDKSFIKHVSTDHKKQSLVEAMIRMGQSMKMKVIAEGVENHEEFSFLMNLGCDAAQGYYFSKPLPAEDYERILEKRQNFTSNS